MFTKKFITLCTLLLPIICTGQNIEIKLNCQMSLITRHQDGTTFENEIINETFQVIQMDKTLSIESITGRLVSQSTYPHKNKVDVLNNSDNNKWSLITLLNIDGKKATYSIIIDRNTGNINYQVNFNQGIILSNAQGTCKKVDTTKRLF
jgi:hypothetical protein